MRHLLPAFFLFCVLRCSAQYVPTQEIDGTIDWSSYGDAYVLGAAEFESYFVNVYPQFTNHILFTGSSGQNTGSQWQNLEEKRNLPWWNAGKGTNNDWVLANDNASLSFTDTTNYTTQLFLAPPIFNNGTAPTNEGINIPVGHFALGRIPANIAGGDSGSVVGNAASMSVATNFNTPIVDSWHLLYTNGLLTANSDFYAFGHPDAPSSLAMALLHIKALGYETNIGSLTIDYATATATTNHFTASSISVSSGVTATIRSDRMPPGFDVPDGNLRTNDARKCFVKFPALGNILTWTIAVTNLPAGNWQGYMDGVLILSGTSSQWASGFNMFTNYSGPFWAQRLATLDAIRDGYGMDRYNVQTPTHNAGSNGSISGKGDRLNYNSHGDLYYTTQGHRGATYLSDMATSVSDLYAYDLAKHATAVQTNHTFTVVPAPLVNISTLNVSTLHIGP